VFTVLAALSGMEREYIRDRTLEGHESASTRGKASAAPPSPTTPCSPRSQDQDPDNGLCVPKTSSASYDLH
jgi:hypothetical protein